jgi:hypothetical protein
LRKSAAVVLVGLLRLTAGALVDEANLETAIQEGHDLESLGDGLRAKVDVVEDRRVGREGDRRPGASARRRTGDLQLPLRLATVLEGHLIVVAVAIDLEDQFGRQRVDDRDTDTVESARDLVAPAAELSAGVQRREDDLGGRLTGVLGVLLDRNAAAVVGHPTAAVGEDRDVDSRANTGHCLVDGVVDELADEVVQPRGTGGTDVHAGSDPDWFETFENGDVDSFVAIGFLGLLGHEGFLPVLRSWRVSRSRRQIFDCSILPEKL